MIKITNQEIVGWEHAIRGMRNPMNSWDKSDSFCVGEGLHDDCMKCSDRIYCEHEMSSCGGRVYRSGDYIGKNDLDLMNRLAKSGTDHRKFMRMIVVYADIIAPLYWWKEYDTYKVGTVANSCSTMHKIHSEKITVDDFSFDCLGLELTDIDYEDGKCRFVDWTSHVADMCEQLRTLFVETKDMRYWRALIQLLPESYNQKRTVMLNYEVLCNIYKSRKNHKLDEWQEFCKWIETLPHSELIKE